MHPKAARLAVAATAVVGVTAAVWAAAGNVGPPTPGIAEVAAASPGPDPNVLPLIGLVAAHRGHGRPRLLQVSRSQADTLYTLRDSGSFYVLAGLLNGHLRFQEVDLDLGRRASGPVNGYEWLFATDKPSSPVVLARPVSGNAAQDR